jgi:hypothetical protein
MSHWVSQFEIMTSHNNFNKGTLIEHVWNEFGRRVYTRPNKHTTVNGLRRALTEEWNNIPQTVIQSIILSMRRRCTACITFQTCSIGAKSGDEAGHGITRMFTLFRKSMGILAVCVHALSCWYTRKSGCV